MDTKYDSTKNQNQTRLNIFLPPDVITKLREKATSKGITLSAFIRMILLEYLAK